MRNHSPTYNLKAVVNETNLSPATLRAWERRYGLIKPQRSAGGHRLYSENDIQMLKWLVAKQKEGMSISNAVELWRSLEESQQDPLQLAVAGGDLAGAPGIMLDDLRRDWIKACLVFDERNSVQVLRQAFAIAAPETVCIEILQKGLAEIGEAWYAGSVSVQQEHFASALAMRRLSALLAAAAPPTRAGRILAACPPGEQHEFVLLLMTFLMRRRGVDVVYLGADVPLPRLDTAMRLISPQLVLSVAQTLNSAASLKEMARYVNINGVYLAYGGSIFNTIPDLQNRISGFYLGSKLDDAPMAVEHLLTQFPPFPEIQPALPEYRILLERFVAKEALIVALVNSEILPTRIEPAHLEEANTNFTKAITGALSLGDINYLTPSIRWLEKLLRNYGLSPALTGYYFKAYRQAVEQHLGDQGELILEWFANVERRSEIS